VPKTAATLKNQLLGVEKWLEMPGDERIITKTTGKAQFES